MHKEYIRISFSTADTGKIEILVALLAEAGYSGFEETENGLLAFIEKDAFNEDELKVISGNHAVRYEKSIVAAQNWNTEWESSFEPIVVGDFAAIRADFHDRVTNTRHEITITPKMSFGTGHHATTYMMIEQMQGIDFKNKVVADFGTGTGVLAILAEKSGAVSIDAIDNDDWSIENAKENAAANNCSRIKLFKADGLTPGKIYDIILANINLNVIVAALPAIAKAMNKGGELLLSGFLKQDEPVLLQLLPSFNLIHSHTAQKGEWICVKLKMK
jgi:ribosomal protein L11 methyltransferase